MAARKKAAASEPVVTMPDRREPEDKVICPLCGTQVLEAETDTYLDSATGTPRLRCADCRQPRKPASPVEVIIEQHKKPARKTVLNRAAAPADAGAADARSDEISDAVEQARRASEAADAAEARLVEAMREVDALRREHGRAVKGLEKLLAEQSEHVDRLMARLRDYEIILGFELPITDERQLSQVQPWMLEVAAGVARRAPDVIDEKKLTGLLLDGIVEAYAERTLEAVAIVTALSSTAAGGPLLEMEKTVRLVADLIAHFPESPADMRKDAIMAAWEQLNVHTRTARAQIEEEIRRLIHLDRVEKYQATATAQVLAPAMIRSLTLVRGGTEDFSSPVAAEDDY